MTIILHAGMPKAGSTTIQDWLRENAELLRERGIVLVVAPRTDSAIAFQPYEEGQVNAGWIVRRIAEQGTDEGRAAAIDEFVEALACAAERYGDVVVTGEFLAHPFWALHRQTLTALQGLATSYGLRVAYYARPQHTALEAAWREFGWQQRRVPPSDFVEQRALWLRYAATRDGVRSLAPSIDFEPRPLREDMLDDGDLIADFAGRFLGVEARGVGERSNRGLPLEAAIALRAAPAGRFDRGDAVAGELKRLLSGRSAPASDRVALSRMVLRAYAHQTFGAENAALGWADLVPPPGGEDIPGLAALDELWMPEASPAELALLFAAVEAALDRA